MKAKLYPFFLWLLMSAVLPARSQDSATCNARFYATVYQQQATFQAVDSQGVIWHYWSFGDSARSGLFKGSSSMFHVYGHPGTYQVTHVIKDSTGGACHDSSTQIITINAVPDCQLYFTTTTDTNDHHRLTFVAYPTPSAGAADTVRWFVKDSLVGKDSLIGTGLRLVNQYFPSGTFTVCARLTTSHGCQAQACGQVVIWGTDTIPGQPAPIDTCIVQFGYTRNPQRTNEISFTIEDSARYDTVMWTVMRTGDSLHTLYPTGKTFTYVFPDSGCYTIGVEAYGRTCAGTSHQEVCIDSISSGPGGFITSYPNPVTSQANLNLKLTTDNTIHIFVFNSMGNQVQTIQTAGFTGINHVAIPVANLPTGIYYVQIQFGNEIRRSKIQKL